MTALRLRALVECRDLRFGYGERARSSTTCRFTVPRGKVTALMGASGGGKTTVLRLIGGQVRAAARRRCCSTARTSASSTATALYAARRRMGMLFQFGALFTDLSVFDNVAFPLREHTDLPEALIRDIVLMKLNAVGLRGARDLMPSEVSGGMARRVALARAIALDPDLVMYDEPFAGLDPISLGTAAHLIRQLNDTLGITSIVVSHDLEETFRIADHVIVLANGQVAAQGTPDEVRAQHRPAGAPVRQCACPTARCTSTIPASERRGRLRRLPAGARAMSWWQPADVGFAVRGKLADLGYRRAPVPAPGRAGRRRACAASAWCATRSTSSATTRWRSSPCPACSSASCSGLQGYYTLQRYGSSEALGLLVALSLVRELGPGGDGAAVRRPRRHLADRRDRPDEGGRAADAPWR